MQQQETPDQNRWKTQLKQQKLQIDAAAKADQLEIERERINAQKEIAGLQAGVQIAKSKQEIDVKQQIEGLKVGVDVSKHKAQLATQIATQLDQQANQPTKGE